MYYLITATSTNKSGISSRACYDLVTGGRKEALLPYRATSQTIGINTLLLRTALG